ncbi:helix-turn-helix transcriptional regulator [Streptomyces sp. TBY4]|nr:helix-turn-helix transcriptional regulator [Streptomyces sp. TBY4]MCP3754190.1 helix-turn-helix transcriptional regulator [Streptomyces sp. TBY4]
MAVLGPLGLDEGTELVYRFILENPSMGIDRMGEVLGWERSALNTALDRLADLALLRPSLNDPGHLRAVPPELALEALLARHQAELARRQQEIEQSRVAVAGLLADYSVLRVGQPSGGVERLVGLDAIRTRLEELAYRARREALAFAPGGPQPAANREAAKPLAQATLKRGVGLRTVYLDSVVNDPGSREHAQWLVASGAEIRTAPSLPMRMHVIDREVVLVPLDPQDSSAGAVVIHEAGALAGFCALFDQVWASATPFGEAPARGGPEMTAQETTLLRLLADGMTDEAAARKLGVSLRTERRMITELSNRLEAGSRFQLGRRAAELGLL